jgi:class 3 adenylate cyclase
MTALLRWADEEHVVTTARDDRLEAGREALRRHAWSEAALALSEADATDGLAPDDLERLASASWWSGDMDGAVDALERAFAGHVDRQDASAAAIVALRLADLALVRLSFSLASGWMARAERLLADEPEGAGHAWLALIQGLVAVLSRGDYEGGSVLLDRSLDLARAHRSLEAETLALSLKGQVLLRRGRWAEGLALIDEAAAAATSDRMDPKTACDVYCLTITACSDLGEYRRAGEWIDQADRWMARRSLTGYRGVCRLHRATLKRLRGAWEEAEREAIGACQELEQFRILDSVGYAYYEVGEVRSRMGDVEAAEAAFARAYEHGRDPQPGLALLTLARGDAEEAARMIARSLDEGEGALLANDMLRRSRLLAAQVEIALARDDLETAGAASAELGEIASSYACDVLHALARTAEGAVALAEGTPGSAITSLTDAWRRWQRAEVPYEAARARVLLGRARIEAGDRRTAELDLQAARSTFVRLGAAPDVPQVDSLLRRLAHDDDESARVTTTFLFTDIVESTKLAAAVGDRNWKSVIAWHDETLRKTIKDHDGVVVRQTGDGFFATFERAEDAIACAVAIQRRVADHRRQNGYPASLRIGLHTADAIRHEGDFAGEGVHVAARVTALGGRDEIVASRATVDAAAAVEQPLSPPRSVTLAGVETPVEVHSVTWT